MSLRDRLRSKKEASKEKNVKTTKSKAETCEFVVSVDKVVKAVNKVDDTADLGNIVQEFSKFLATLPTKNASISIKGSFDLGQRTLLSCVLANFIENPEAKEVYVEQPETKKETSKLIRKRKSLKSKLAEIEEIGEQVSSEEF